METKEYQIRKLKYLQERLFFLQRELELADRQLDAYEYKKYLGIQIKTVLALIAKLRSLN